MHLGPGKKENPPQMMQIYVNIRYSIICIATSYQYLQHLTTLLCTVQNAH